MDKHGCVVYMHNTNHTDMTDCYPSGNLQTGANTLNLNSDHTYGYHTRQPEGEVVSLIAGWEMVSVPMMVVSLNHYHPNTHDHAGCKDGKNYIRTIDPLNSSGMFAVGASSLDNCNQNDYNHTDDGYDPASDDRKRLNLVIDIHRVHTAPTQPPSSRL